MLWNSIAENMLIDEKTNSIKDSLEILFLGRLQRCHFIFYPRFYRYLVYIFVDFDTFTKHLKKLPELVAIHLKIWPSLFQSHLLDSADQSH